MGIILTVFHICGNLPAVRERLKSLANGEGFCFQHVSGYAVRTIGFISSSLMRVKNSSGVIS